MSTQPSQSGHTQGAEHAQTPNDVEGRAEEVLRRGRALKQDADALAGELRGALTDVERGLDIRGRVERHPYAMVAAAAGVGYVLGGGLFSRFTGQVLRLGVRAMLIPLLKNELMALGEAAVEGMGDPVKG
jgi:ElaB/YqjD/DUF883 family membrane-anchored ribosome-binding protein